MSSLYRTVLVFILLALPALTSSLDLSTAAPWRIFILQSYDPEYI